MVHISSIFRHVGGDGAPDLGSVRKLYKSRSQIVEDAIRSYDPSLHAITDKSKYPDEIIYSESPTETDEYGEPILVSELVKIPRIPLGIEKDIINKKAIFATGGGIVLEPNDDRSELFKRIESDFYDSKLDLVAKDALIHLMASTQVAIIFYSPAVDNLDDFSFKHKLVSPLKGDVLEPFFDPDTDDLIAFGREYTYFDKKRYDLYSINDSGNVEIHRYINGKPMFDPDGNYEVIVTPYTKLPVIYMELDQGECEDIKVLREEFERTFNGFIDQNDRTGDPIMFIKGNTISLPAKGKRGKVMAAEGTDSDKADAKFLSPANATESRSLQFEMMENYMYSLCNTIKFDIDTFKGTGATSAVAIEQLLTPLYLDAKEKQDGVLGMFYQRMMNWLTHETKTLLNSSEKLKIYVKFNKLSFRGVDEQIETAMKANGGLPVVDHLQSIVMAGLSMDAKKTLDEINKDTSTLAD